MLLYDAYNQIIFYGQADASVLIAVFKSLRFIKAKASKNNIELINSYAKHIFGKQSSHSNDKLEYSKIQKEYRYLMEL